MKTGLLRVYLDEKEK